MIFLRVVLIISWIVLLYKIEYILGDRPIDRLKYLIFLFYFIYLFNDFKIKYFENSFEVRSARFNFLLLSYLLSKIYLL